MPDDKDIEAKRDSFKHDKTLVNIIDYGAGSQISGKRIRTIRSIANGGISTSKKSKFIRQLIRYFNCKIVVELGTSLGINTLYLAKATPNVKVWTFEGCLSLADIAQKVFDESGCVNIKIIKGDLYVTLPEYLEEVVGIDLVFFDANHTYQSTMDYFTQIIPNLSDTSIVIIDDIYWSKEMTKAWIDIMRRFPDATFLDIYYCGIILFNKNLSAVRHRLTY